MLQQAYLSIFTLKEYGRATWFYMEFLIVMITLFISLDHFWLIEKQYVYIALGILAICIAVITTTKITNREANSRIYIHMTKAISRRKYLIGKAIAIFMLDATVLFVMYLLAYRFTQLSAQISFFEGIIRMIPILFVLVISIMVILLTSRLVLNKAYYILLGISFLILGFYQPSKELGYILPPIQQLIKGSFTKPLMNMKLELILACFYVAVLGLVAGIIFNKKELDYEHK